MIAMSLICDPKLIIADEPTTTLDVTIAQILDLMKDLKKKLNASIILITHDLGVICRSLYKNKCNVWWNNSRTKEVTRIFSIIQDTLIHGIITKCS